MKKLLTSLLFVFLISWGIFIASYLQVGNINTSINTMLNYIVPVASSTLFIIIAINFQNSTINIFHIIIYTLIILCIHFFGTSHTTLQTTAAIKKGIILQHPVGAMSFGQTIKVDEGIYHVSNVYVSLPTQTNYAQQGKIITNKLILTVGEQNTEIPMFVNMDLVFPLWGVTNINTINPMIGIQDYNQLPMFQTGILLAITKYLIYFIVLLIIGCIGLAAQGFFRLTMGLILNCIICFIGVFYFSKIITFYGLAIAQAIIYKI